MLWVILLVIPTTVQSETVHFLSDVCIPDGSQLMCKDAGKGVYVAMRFWPSVESVHFQRLGSDRVLDITDTFLPKLRRVEISNPDFHCSHVKTTMTDLSIRISGKECQVHSLFYFLNERMLSKKKSCF